MVPSLDVLRNVKITCVFQIKDKMKIWIDIDNAPHVNFMEPIIVGLHGRGIKTIVTARDYGQTVPLLEMKGIAFSRIDGDYTLPRAVYTLQRAYRLYRHLRDYDIDVAFSHGSRSMAIAGRLLRKRTIVTFDYEYVEHRIFNLFATDLFLPDVLQNDSLDKIGYDLDKISFYPGYKENVYLSNHRIDNQFPKHIDMDLDKVIISSRPPAQRAHYYSQSIFDLFWKTIKYVAKSSSLQIYVVPRYKDSIKSAKELSKHISSNIVVLEHAVNGLDLLNYSDLFIGAGGTMNREAALLNTPSYSLFYKKGEVDRSLEQKGLLHFIQNDDDIKKIKIEKKKKKIALNNSSNLSNFFVNHITEIRDRL
jgi:predicted glycosyltransferase